MVLIKMENHSYLYECENLCRVFFPNEVITADEKNSKGENSAVITVLTSVTRGEERTLLFAKVAKDDKSSSRSDELLNSEGDFDGKCERLLMTSLFNALKEFTGYTPPWGILTGVRPAKLLHALCRETGSEDGAVRYFQDELFVTAQKAALARRVAENENKIIELSRPESFSLYISVPFCPTRCSYCSFVSSSMKSAGKLTGDYVELLKREISETGKIAEKLGLRLETVYYGGGTPTTLSAAQLKEIIDGIENAFDLKNVREYTIEAGRPDTITREKLEVIHSGIKKRISINPQTMNDDVLKRIGRNHTSEDFLEAFALARELGFDNINCDVIAGLEGDSEDSFERTVRALCSLSPENITVHTLALKRSSFLAQSEKSLEKSGETAAHMLEIGERILSENGYEPYYMYRQSKMAGNLENVGWCKNGFGCLYNVYMMDETHTVLSCGAGAVTKLRAPGENRIERIFNYKYPFEYVSGFDALLSRKARISQFYSEI